MLRSHDNEKPASETNAVDNVDALWCDFLLWVQRRYVLLLDFYFQVCEKIVFLVTLFLKIGMVGSHPYFYTNISLLAFFRCGEYGVKVELQHDVKWNVLNKFWCSIYNCESIAEFLGFWLTRNIVVDPHRNLVLLIFSLMIVFFACQNISQHIYRVFLFRTANCITVASDVILRILKHV